MAAKPDLGKRFVCFKCECKFYDLGAPVPLCPRCGADQRENPNPDPRAALRAGGKPKRKRKPKAKPAPKAVPAKSAAPKKAPAADAGLKLDSDESLLDDEGEDEPKKKAAAKKK